VPGWLWKPPENAARISGDSLLLSCEVFSRIFYFASPAVIRGTTITAFSETKWHHARGNE
jgi:hypothetical protein